MPGPWLSRSEVYFYTGVIRSDNPYDNYGMSIYKYGILFYGKN